jgi:tetratricopeptide (TPR) repeat protein
MVTSCGSKKPVCVLPLFPEDADYIQLSQTIPLPSRDQQRIDSVKNKLLASLKRSLAERIQTEVVSTGRSRMEEEDSTFKSNTSVELKVSSMANLNNVEESDCIDYRRSELHVAIRLNKKLFARSLFLDCMSRLKVLAAAVKDARVDWTQTPTGASLYESDYQTLLRDKRTALFFDSEINTGEWEAQSRLFMTAVNEYKSSQKQRNYELEIEKAKSALIKDDYATAIKTYKKLLVSNPSNTELRTQLDEALFQMKKQLLPRVQQLIQRLKYDDALTMCQDYCLLSDEMDCLTDLRKQISISIVSNAYDAFTKAIPLEDEATVNRTYQRITELAFVKPEITQQVENQYRDFNIRMSTRRILSLESLGNYLEAYELLNKIELKYGRANVIIQKLRKSIYEGLLEQEYDRIKKTKPFNYSFLFGIDAMSNLAHPEYLQEYTFKSIHPMYVLGVYRKIFRKNRELITTPSSEATMLGIYMRAIDQVHISGFKPTEASRPYDRWDNRWFYQFGIDIYTDRIAHYALGVAYTANDRLDDPSFYTLAAGLRIPMNAFSLQTDIQLWTNLNGRSLLGWSAGLYYRLDFHRQFGRKDRRLAKARLREYAP